MKTIEEKAIAYDEVLKKARTKLNEDITQDTKNALLTVFPELREDKTERIKKSLKRLIEAFYDNNFPTPEGFTRNDLLDWLEKQGEQCKYGYIQTGKKYKCLVSPRYTTFKAGNIYKPEDTFIWSLMNLCHDCFELVDGEQESMPKFKVGDWVVSPNGVYWHIDAISNNRYEVSSVTGECADWPLDTDLYHRWSIQDAKPGDIIATLDYILIFKGHLEKEGGTSYCHYDFGAGNPQFIWLEDNNWYFGEKAVLSPATKEQRDLLFQKMSEAGYEWDSRKLELKKGSLEYPLCNSIKDKIDYYIFNHFTLDKVVTTDVNSIVKAMKEGVRLGQEPLEWDKEDEENSTYVCAALDAYCRLREEKNNTSGQEKLDAAIAWINNRLKSLKPKEFNPVIKHRQKLYDIIDTAEHHCFLSLEDREYLKKLRDINPYDKIWTEEDDKFFEELYKEIEQGYKDANIEQLKDIYSRRLQWLESIKSRLT